MKFETYGRKVIRAVDWATDWLLRIALCIALFFCFYSLWDANQVYRRADAANYAVYRPDGGDDMGFAELRRINSEVIAWLTVDGTPIDYPVTQGSDNLKYLDMNARGEYTLSGSIFLDSRNSPTFDDFNSIFYGHQMEKKKMFGALSDFAEETFFREHPYGNLYFDGKGHTIEFFAFVLTDAYDRTLFSAGVEDEEGRRAYIDRARSAAIWTREVPVTPQDQIVALSTCTTELTSGRYMLFGKLSEEPPAP